MKKYIITIIIGFILIGLGGGIVALEVMDYDYIDKLPTTIVPTTDIFNYDLENKNIYIDEYNNDTNYIIDNKITSGKIKVEVTYFNKINRINPSDSIINGNRIISYSVYQKTDNFKYVYDMILDNLKTKKIYNYTLLNNVVVNVYMNSSDVKYVKSYDDIDESDFYLKDETIVCPSMLEEIARDTNYIYYLKCIKSNTIYLIYNDNTKISVKNALKTNIVTIYELLDAGLDVYQENINN